MPQTPLAERLYRRVANDGAWRTPAGFSDQARRSVPGNFLRLAGALVLTNLADLLMNPKTVLAWVLAAVGAPVALITWLVPVRESGALLPQLVLGAWLRRHPVRKGFWVLGGIGQALCVLGMAASLYRFEGTRAGLAILALLALFSVSRGLCSVAVKDVQGKTILPGERGRLSGLAATLAGGVTIVLTLVLLTRGGASASLVFYAGLLIGASVLWWLAVALFSRVQEDAGEYGNRGRPFAQALANLSLLRDDHLFRHFLITRALLMASALSAPLLVVLARESSTSGGLLAGFVLASALANTCSAGIWGWMADASSRQVLLRGGALAALTCLGASALAGLDGSARAPLFPVLFFVLAVAHGGVRIGRTTYLVNLATGNRRTDYTAVSNTVIGVLLLVAGGLTAALARLSPVAALLGLGLMGATGALSAARLPAVEPPRSDT